MSYWMTTHWPPTEDVEPEGVYLPDDRRQAGDGLAIGDLVLIYESRSGRKEPAYKNGEDIFLSRTSGKQGIIAIAEVTSPLKERTGVPPCKYADGTEIWWRWHAETKLISTNGFVPRSEVNSVFDYSNNYYLRGFGDMKSGLKKLTPNQFSALLDSFKKHPRQIPEIRKAIDRQSPCPHSGLPESLEHRMLKEYVASNPAVVLGENGLKTVGIEYKFPTGDRADILLEDSLGRIVGVEIEVTVGINNLECVLQAIKYRYMSAVTHVRQFYETRAFLIAYEVNDEIAEICRSYDVEIFVIPYDTMPRKGVEQ